VSWLFSAKGYGMNDNPTKSDVASVPPPPFAIAAVLLFSADAKSLAAFYRDELGVPLQHISVSGVEPHWACDIRQVYFSIWPAKDTKSKEVPEALRAGVAFYVKDVRQQFERLVAKGVRVEAPPNETSLGLIARMRDPDGNLFEIYQPATHVTG
jgi:catechol 2,3-dioxygenase-like lactoylglutathione lyase family enzyme